MSYTTLDQLKKRFGDDILIRVTDRTNPPTGLIDVDTVDQALLDTDAIIDGYLQARYALPVASVPTQLRDLAMSIAIYKLHIYSAEDKITQDYKDALRTLREISDGTIVLTIAGKSASNNGASGVRITDRERPFTNKNLSGFIG